MKQRINMNSIVLGLLILALASSFYLINESRIFGSATGFMGENSMIQELDLTLTSDYEQTFSLDDSLPIESIRLNGTLTKGSSARVYAVISGERYLLFNSSTVTEEGSTASSQGAEMSPDDITDIEENSTNQTKQISIDLVYMTGTDYDIDNDGIETANGVIDFTIEDTGFNWEADDSGLCTRWATINSDTATLVCHGNPDCCALFSLVPAPGMEWDSAFELFQGRYSAGQENEVRAQVIYANYSLEGTDDSYFDIAYSEWAGLTAEFIEETASVNFTGSCEETCALEDTESDEWELVVEIDEGVLYLDEAALSFIEVNSPPEFIGMNITVLKNTNTQIDIDELFTDPDNDALEYRTSQPDNLAAATAGSILTLFPNWNFVGEDEFVITADDSKQETDQAVSIFVVEELAVNLTNMTNTTNMTNATNITNATNVTFNATIKDSRGRDIEAIIEFLNRDSGEIESVLDLRGRLKERYLASDLELSDRWKGKRFMTKLNLTRQDFSLRKGRHKALITLMNHTIRRIELDGLDINDNTTDFIKVDEVAPFGNFVKVYAVDPTSLNFTEGNVTVTADGNELYKCKDWNFTEQKCYGNWIKLMAIQPGKNYTFRITPDDPGFGELINITKAWHLDENRSIISDIYNELYAPDSIWSEPIYHDEYVRVTFDKNLTNESDITVYARNNQSQEGMNTTIEVYQHDSDEIITTFHYISQEKYYKVFLTELTGSNDTFDLRIVNDAGNASAFLEFDYIKDNPGPPTIYNLTNPANQSTVTQNPIEFNYTASDDDSNDGTCSVYGNFSGSWGEEKASIISDLLTPKERNITTDINHGKYIWTIRCNDSNDEIAWYGSNSSVIVSIFGSLGGVLDTPAPQQTTSFSENKTFNINATVTCTGNVGGTCGEVNGTARYNSTNVQSNSIKNIVKLSGSGGTDAGSFDITISPALDNISKAFALLSFRHSQTAQHAFTFKSYEIIDASTIRVYGRRDTPAGNLPVNYEGVVVEFSSDSPVATQQAKIGLPATGASNPSSGTISSVTPAQTILMHSGHNHNATETTIGTEELERVRITGATTWEWQAAAAPNTGGQEVRAQIIDFGDSDYVVQRGQVQMGSTDTLVNLTNGVDYNTIDRTRSMVFVSFMATGGTTSEPPSDSALSATLDSGGNLIIQRNTASAAPTPDINWEIVEFPENMVNVQHGTISQSGGTASSTDTITAVSNISRSFATGTVSTPFGHGGGRGASTTTDAFDRSMWTLELTADDTVTAIRGTGTGAGVVGYQAVEFLSEGLQLWTPINTSSGAEPLHTTYANPLSCGILDYGESCTLNWSVNATGDIGSLWLIDVFFESSLGQVADNATLNATVNITGQNPMNIIYEDPTPANGSLQAATTATVNVTVTDADGVANCTLEFDSTNYTMEEKGTGSQKTCNYTITSLTSGLYNFTVHANDTASQITQSTRRWFTVDATKPSVFNISPEANSTFNIGTTIEISANATNGAAGVDTVLANITLPNSTSQVIELTQAGTTDKYNSSFTIPGDLGGRYDITYKANDTVGNLNDTESTYFLANIAPVVISLDYPSNGASLTQTTLDFNFTAADERYNGLATCILYANFTGTFLPQGTASNVVNNTESNITVQVPDGSFIWNVNCSDAGGLSAFYSSNYTVSVDTGTEGIFTYHELDDGTPRYRIWNEFNYTGNELSDTNAVGGDITWMVLKANHERNEWILGTEDKQNDVNIQVYDGNAEEWGNLNQVSESVPNAAYRSFDIAYEYGSGDALMVYEDSSGNDQIVKYRTWDGSSYSSEETLTTGLASSPANWIELTPKKNSDQIMLLVHNNNNELYAVPWNGTGFNTSQGSVLSSGTASNDEQNFAFAWEESSFEGIVAYGESTNFVYRTYSPATLWGSEQTLSLGADSLDAVRMCSENDTDYIGIIIQDSGNDVNVRMWGGSGILASPPTQDGETEQNGANNANIDCAWQASGDQALFGFVDSGAQSVDYFTFTKATDSWSTASLTSTGNTGNFASNAIRGMRFIPNPRSEEIMVVAMDTSEDVSTIRWDGTQFQTIANAIIETNTEILNGDQEGAVFDWSRYDPRPSVYNIEPVNGTDYNASVTINFSANVTDDLQVDTVLANISLPNSTYHTLILYDTNGNSVYNSTWTTTWVGVYNVIFLANDTSPYSNINDSKITAFIINDHIAPSVFDLRPINGSDYNTSDTIEIGANVTDQGGVDNVYANVTLPNTSVVNIALSQQTGTDKYNSSFTIPELIGTYMVNFSANDTSGNLNTSEVTFFVGNDARAPTWASPTEQPADPATFSESQFFQFNTTWIDNIAIGEVFIEHNFSSGDGSLENFSLSGNQSSVFFYNITGVAAGSYVWRTIANDTSGNYNQTSQFSYIVNRNQTVASLYLNGSQANLSLVYGNGFNATGVTDILNVSLYLDGVVVNDSGSVVSFYNEALGVGHFNLTAVNSGSENYS
ncbi:hypothetical protein GF345_03135, partial [Candidatus Woesearchaeota archaeon]|nr:hypothetical protein [Candidatus Woesearchaeota archaeon]